MALKKKKKLKDHRRIEIHLVVKHEEEHGVDECKYPGDYVCPGCIPYCCQPGEHSEQLEEASIR